MNQFKTMKQRNKRRLKRRKTNQIARPTSRGLGLCVFRTIQKPTDNLSQSKDQPKASPTDRVGLGLNFLGLFDCFLSFLLKKSPTDRVGLGLLISLRIFVSFW